MENNEPALRPEELDWQGRRKREPIYQVSTLQSLVMGNYYGSCDMATLLDHGDIGLGTFDAVAGELIVIDGKCYQILGDGSAVEAKPDDTTPFASVAWLTEGETIRFGRLGSIEALKDALDERVDILGVNNMYVVRIDGHFNWVAARTELRQEEPYKPFAEVLKTDERRFKFENLDGTLIAFYFPTYLEGVNTPSWHLHFISADRKWGGHVFDIDMQNGKAILNKTDRFVMDLPHNKAFDKANLKDASQDEIKQIEQGK